MVVACLLWSTAGGAQEAADSTPESAPVVETLPPADGPAEEAPAVVPVVKQRMWVPDFALAKGVDVSQSDVDTATALTALFAGRAPQLEVISAREVRQMLAMEAQRSAVGCESDSCMAEIASALDVSLLLTGQVTRIGPKVVIHLSLVDVDDAKTLKREIIQVRRSAELAEAIRTSMHAMLQPYGGIGEEKKKAEVARTGWAKSLSDFMRRSDSAMFGATYGAAMAAGCLPVFPFVPVLQGLAFWWLGDDLAGRDYPLWWAAIPAGYAVYLVSGLLGAGFVALGFNQEREWLAATYVYAGISTFFIGVFVVEPLVSWGGGVIGARDLAWGDEGEGGDEAGDTPAPPAAPAQALGWRLPTASPWTGPPPLALVE